MFQDSLDQLGTADEPVAHISNKSGTWSVRSAPGSWTPPPPPPRDRNGVVGGRLFVSGEHALHRQLPVRAKNEANHSARDGRPANGSGAHPASLPPPPPPDVINDDSDSASRSSRTGKWAPFSHGPSGASRVARFSFSFFSRSSRRRRSRRRLSALAGVATLPSAKSPVRSVN